MALEGNLADVSLADIIQLLALGRKTGCLTVTDRSNFGYVYFDGGRVIHASVLNRPDRLGEILVKNGVITREQLSEAMERQAHEPESRVGELLIALGALSEDDLNHYISVQIEEAVYHLFTWEQGAFHFNPDQRPDEERSVLVSIPAEALLMEGARRVDEWGQIEKKISSFDLIFSLEREPEENAEIEITADQKKVIPLLDGQRTVRDVIDESGLVEFDVAKAIYALLQAGYVQRIGKKSSDGEEESPEEKIARHLKLGAAFYRSGMLEDAAREFRRVVELAPEQEEARFRLGLICIKADSAKQALEHFDAIPEPRSESYPVLRNRALALEMLGLHEEALVTLEDADEKQPGDPELLLARGIVQLKAEDGREARETFEQYRSTLGKNLVPPPIYYNFAMLAAAAAGDLEEAASLGREGLSRYEDNPWLLVNAGAVLERKGEMDAAEAFYTRALAQDPVPPQAYKSLGDLAFSRGDRTAARAHYERAVKLDPQLGDGVYLRLGEIAMERDEGDVALLLWKRALQLNPKNETVQARLSEAGAA